MTELEEQEAYNKVMNDKLSSRPIGNLITCDLCENKFPKKWCYKYYQSCGAESDYCCPKDPCCSELILINCAKCNGDGYVTITA